MLETAPLPQPRGLSTMNAFMKSLNEEQVKLAIVVAELNDKLNKVEGKTAELSNQLSELINN